MSIVSYLFGLLVFTAVIVVAALASEDQGVPLPTATAYLDKDFAAVPGQPVVTKDLRRVLGLDWKQRDGRVFGESDVYDFLVTAGVSTVAAGRVAAGWAGGRLDQYRSTRPDNDAAVTNLTLAWRTYEDWAAFKAILEAAFAGRNSPLPDGGEYFGRWSPLGPEAFAAWDPANRRAEVVFGSDQGALERVRRLLLR